MGKGNGVSVYLCPKCNWSDFFEIKTCPRCHNEMKESSLSGRGKVATFTVIRYPPKGFEKQVPYIVALIDLDEGPRVIGRITANPNELRINQIVHYAGRVDGAIRFEV